MRALPSGLIFHIARDAGIDVPARGDKRRIRCPFHDDAHPSAFVSERNIFYCSVCTPDAGWPAKRFAETLHRGWSQYASVTGTSSGRSMLRNGPTFLARHALETWEHARSRTIYDAAVEQDRDVYDFLIGRGLSEPFEDRSFGILANDERLHPAVRGWPNAGYRLIVPLYDPRGEVRNVQARATNGRVPRTMFPKGSVAHGTLFADAPARQILRGEDSNEQCVLFGEGLTDFLALSRAAPVPVFCAPGTGMAVSGVGSWVLNREVLIALDCDAAGEKVLDAVAKKIFERGGRRVRRIVWPGKAKDACDVLMQYGIEALAEVLRHEVHAEQRQ